MSKIFIPIPKEFSYEMNFQFLERSPRELLHKTEGKTVYKLIKTADEKILFTLREGDGKLIVEFQNGKPSVLGKTFVKNYVREWWHYSFGGGSQPLLYDVPIPPRAR